MHNSKKENTAMMDFTKIKDKKAAGKCFDYAILPKETTEAEIRMQKGH